MKEIIKNIIFIYFNIIYFRRKRKRRDATGKIDYDRPPDYNLPHVPHPPGNVAVSKVVF